MKRSHTFMYCLSAALLLLFACQPAPATSFTETFESADHWTTSVDAVAEVNVREGALIIHVFEPGQVAWTAHDGDYSNLTVSVDTRVLDGPLDNEYGLLLHMQDEQAFLAFSISSDGYARVARYQDMTWKIVGNDWTPVDQINQGLEANHLSVTANAGQYTFRVNNQVVMEVDDKTFTKGTIGLYAGAFSSGDVQVAFDNLEVQSGE